jgi:hypothetical protein
VAPDQPAGRWGRAGHKRWQAAHGKCRRDAAEARDARGSAPGGACHADCHAQQGSKRERTRVGRARLLLLLLLLLLG